MPTSTSNDDDAPSADAPRAPHVPGAADVSDVVAALQRFARERRPDEPLLETFIGRYYRELLDEDVDEQHLDDAYAAGVAHYSLGRVRRGSETLVRVMVPDRDEGWTSDRSALMFVTDDVPYLVDTVRMVLDDHDLGIHLLVHPTLRVERDDRHRLTAIGAGVGEIEAWTLIELDRCTPALAETIERDVHTAIERVHGVVDDFPAMRERLREVADGQPLLRWLGEEHFVFLGAATYQRSDGRLQFVQGSGLGEYRPGQLAPDAIDPPVHPGSTPYVIARTDAVSRVHRRARMTSLAVRSAALDLEYRFIGLLGSAAYRQSVFMIPEVGDVARSVIDSIGVDLASHTGRGVRNVLETLPRDVVFELGAEELTEIVTEIVGLQERRIVRVFDVSEPVGPWTTVLIYVPRTRFAAQLPERVARLVSEHYGGEVRDIETLLSTSSLARISVAVRAAPIAQPERLAAAIDEISTGWDERAVRALIDRLGDIEGQRVFDIVDAYVPADYHARVAPSDAVDDLVQIAELLEIDGAVAVAGDPESDVHAALDDGRRIRTSCSPSHDTATESWRFRVYLRDRPATIAELVPVLAHLGLSALDEHPSEFGTGDRCVYLYDIGVTVDSGSLGDAQHGELQRAFAGLMTGVIEPDGLNRLVLAAGLTCRQIAVLRLYNRYLRQLGFLFSAGYIEQALVRHPAIARGLVALFDARFDPTLDFGTADTDTDDTGTHTDGRAAQVEAIRTKLCEELDAIPTLDDDRICRAFLTLVDATDRTNAFRGRDEISVKLRPRDIAFVPEPRPMFEIFVCSPKVEGVHLRGGRIARGGLRWSDRPQDFRTEVLGLVKAQMVKNSVIVPVGAKGGFVVKQRRAAATDRDAIRAEGIDRYRRFVRGLLDITDNVVDGEVVHPPDTVIYDDDDQYLVVAADKGTASFSDIANDVAAEYDYWLGDAFASGGSRGYDHKEMGITARGAWESVRRHARVIGKNADTDELTAVGIGDMSGDVFGNGMLMSPRLHLAAAFDHRHVFLDPHPDAAASFGERQRLYDLPRSSWADYDSALISPGGGVYSRRSKSIPLSAEVRDVLGIDSGHDGDESVDGVDVRSMHPDDLISAILRAPVDLLWNGGIGTYVKASTQTHAEVGDRANDTLRIDAADLRCRIVGEGGNLGFTQLARVEYAVDGGLIYTDAIDNSAGVDCSDHEVNIKILLDHLVRDGAITGERRNELLVEMTDEVARLVLDDNRRQTLALLIARTQALAMVNVHARYLDALEADGYLDRELEDLPSDKQIAERQSNGSGLRTPEFAVMIAYTKNADFEEILDSDVPDDPALVPDLLAYFPEPLRTRFVDAICSHRLRREIIATGVVNNMVNLAGISFDHRMTEDTGASVPDVARAFVASRNIFGFADIWEEIDDLATSVDLDSQIALFLDARRMAERGAVWLLRHRHPPVDIGATVDTFQAGLAFLEESLDQVVSGRVLDEIDELRAKRLEAGIPNRLAARSARWQWLHTGFDIVELAHTESCNVADAATAYWSVFDAFDMGWLWDGIGALARSDRWQQQARSALRDDLMSVLADLTRNVMRSADGSPSGWIAANERAVGRVIAMHTEIRRAESFDLTTLSVALRQLRNLTLMAVSGPAE